MVGRLHMSILMSIRSASRGLREMKCEGDSVPRFLREAGVVAVWIREMTAQGMNITKDGQGGEVDTIVIRKDDDPFERLMSLITHSKAVWP